MMNEWTRDWGRGKEVNVWASWESSAFYNRGGYLEIVLYKGQRDIKIRTLPSIPFYTGSSTCLSSSWVRELQAEHRADIRLQQEHGTQGTA